MTTKKIGPILSRREWLNRTLQLCAAGAVLPFASGCRQSQRLVCSDPAKLTDAENSLRSSLQYVEQSMHSGQACSGCGYFEAQGDSGCGNCVLLKGPVNPLGRCDSWSAAGQTKQARP